MSALRWMNINICKQQMELLYKLMEERINVENNTKNGRKSDGKISGRSGCVTKKILNLCKMKVNELISYGSI